MNIPRDFSVIESIMEKFPGYNSEFPVCISKLRQIVNLEEDKIY